MKLPVAITLLMGTAVAANAATPQLYDPNDLWGSMAGYTPFSVPQPFTKTLTDQIFGPDASERAKRYVAEGRWLYCGTEDDPNSFVVPLNDLGPGTAKFPSPCGDNEEANEYVNQGLTLRYAFDDNEAVCSFRKAQELAPDCALAYLFESLAAGPNVNYAAIESPGAYDAILKALGKAEETLEPSKDDPAVEKAYDFFTALHKRYVPPGETVSSMLSVEDEEARLAKYSLCESCNSVYANAMYQIHLKYPDDNDLAAVAVGGLMQSPAWRWWQPGSEYMKLGSDPILETTKQLPNATKANTILKTILSRDPDHLGANHYMIHNIEMGPNPEWAWGIADNIEKLDKFDGHVPHMASHIYSRLGYYDRVIAMNKRSNKVDFQWMKDRTGGGLMTTLYKYEPHNTEFNIVAGWNTKNMAESAASVSLLNKISIFRITANPKSGSLLYKLTYGMQFGIMFELWESIVEGTNPGGSAPFGPDGQITLLDGTIRSCGPCYEWIQFARTIAFARLGLVKEAQSSLANFVYNVTGLISESGQGTSEDIAFAADDVYSAGSVNVDTTSEEATGTLTINNGDRGKIVRAAFANAEVLRAQGLKEEAISEYRRAWSYQKNMFYDEPSPFLVPIASVLGEYMLEDDTKESAQEAAHLFREVLFVHPFEINAVLGLHGALTQLDSKTGRNDAASINYLVDAVTVNAVDRDGTAFLATTVDVDDDYLESDAFIDEVSSTSGSNTTDGVSSKTEEVAGDAENATDVATDVDGDMEDKDDTAGTEASEANMNAGFIILSLVCNIAAAGLYLL